jgi:anti-sigma B factor antagonist
MSDNEIGGEPAPAALESQRKGGSTVVSVSGALDLTIAERLDQAIREAEEDGGAIVVDLREVDFLDSTGLSVLLQARTRQRRDGGQRLSIVGSKHESVTRLLELTVTDELFF